MGLYRSACGLDHHNLSIFVTRLLQDLWPRQIALFHISNLFATRLSVFGYYVSSMGQIHSRRDSLAGHLCFKLLKVEVSPLLRNVSLGQTLSVSSSAQRLSDLENTRTRPSEHPVTISPFGIAATAQTEIAGWVMVCTSSPSLQYPAKLNDISNIKPVKLTFPYTHCPVFS